MTAVLLFSLLAASTTLDCASLDAKATAAYEVPSQSPAQLKATAALLHEAGVCWMQEANRNKATRVYMLEIYLLSRAAAGTPHQAAVEAYLDTFTPEDGQQRYAFVMRHLAVLKSSQGDMAEAFAVLNRLLTITPPTQVRGRAETLLRLGEMERSLGSYEEAVEYIRRADSLVSRHMMGHVQKRQYVRVLIPLAETLLQWHDDVDAPPDALDQAYRAVEEALALAPYSSPSDRAHTLHLAGAIYTRMGRLGEGEALLREAIAVARQADRFEHFVALGRLGRNRLRAGEPAQGLALMEEAYQNAMTQSFFYGARFMRQSQAIAAHQLGDLPSAKAYLRDAIELSEDLRAETGTTEWAASLVGGWQAPYRDLARALADQDSVVAAVAVLEQSRARHLLALQARLARLNSADPRDARQADSLQVLLNEARQALFSARGSRADSLRMQTALLQLRLNEIVGPPPRADSFDYPALQQHLQADDRTVLYYVLDHGDQLFPERQQVSVYVLRADTAVRRVLTVTPAEITAQVRQISGVFQSDAGDVPAGAAAFDLGALHALYEALVAPVADLMPPSGPLTIVPDEGLFAVPFAALVTRLSGRFDYAGATYLGAMHPIQVALSLAQHLPGEGAGNGVLVAGKSTFEQAGLSLPPLEGVRREVRAVSKPLHATSVLLNDEVTRERFLDEARGSRVIHLATHALIDRTSPLYHALVLSPAEGNDGLLHLHEIEGIELHADLVTLSGCNTARGDLRVGEGMAGLQYAFRAVGARSTVSTLWSLSDDASAELFEAFYRALADGLSKDRALQQAQTAFRTRHPNASPFFWASPVLYGSTAPLALPPAPGFPRWALLLGTALIALLGLFFYRFSALKLRRSS